MRMEQIAEILDVNLFRRKVSYLLITNTSIVTLFVFHEKADIFSVNC